MVPMVQKFIPMAKSWNPLNSLVWLHGQPPKAIAQNPFYFVLNRLQRQYHAPSCPCNKFSWSFMEKVVLLWQARMITLGQLRVPLLWPKDWLKGLECCREVLVHTMPRHWDPKWKWGGTTWGTTPSMSIEVPQEDDIPHGWELNNILRTHEVFPILILRVHCMA